MIARRSSPSRLSLSPDILLSNISCSYFPSCSPPRIRVYPYLSMDSKRPGFLCLPLKENGDEGAHGSPYSPFYPSPHSPGCVYCCVAQWVDFLFLLFCPPPPSAPSALHSLFHGAVRWTSAESLTFLSERLIVVLYLCDIGRVGLPGRFTVVILLIKNRGSRGRVSTRTISGDYQRWCQALGL